MTPADYRRLRDEILKISDSEMKRRIGVSKNVRLDEDGTEIKLTVALACAAIARDLRPWPQ